MNKTQRQSNIDRRTAETRVKLYMDLDDNAYEKNSIATGIGFLDHMLTLFAMHGGFRLDVSCDGDTHVDQHHSAEDIGIALGAAYAQCLGDKAGIRRYADIVLPMDEALMMCAVDISGRPLLAADFRIPTEKIGAFDSELVKEFFIAFVRSAGVTLHLRQLAGENSHHIAESVFKASGRVLARAAEYDDRFEGRVPSTKGTI